MKKILLPLIFFFPLFSYPASITHKDWKLTVDQGSGRFILYYKDFPLNQTEFPISSFFSIKIGEEIYHLGDDVGIQQLDTRKDQIVISYKVTAQLLVEVTLSFSENPLVYDDIGLQINVRIDSRYDRPNDLTFRFVYDTFVAEDKLQGYKMLNSKEEITKETKRNLDTVIFYPFFIQSMTKASFTILSAWQRLQENFLPDERPGLNFRDIRTGEWDPAIGFFYTLGEVARRSNDISLFVGLWQKPDRTYPRVKILHPNDISLKRDSKLTLPLLIENTGDFDIDLYKIILSSPYLKTQVIHSGENLLKNAKKQILFNGQLLKMPDVLTGDVKVSMWAKEKTFEQSFQVKLDLKYPPVITKKTTGKKEAKPILDAKQINSVIERINLLLYFVNRGIQTGISDEILEKLKKEVQSLESATHESPAKN